MLKQLSIQNLAIAENVNVDFARGLNIITGETGAGKTLLVDALSLLRGAKADPSLIRHGKESAQVTASFSVDKKNDVYSILENFGIETEDDIVLRKTIYLEQKPKSFVNDTPVSAKVLQQISAYLIDISSQFENQKLLDENSHTEYLNEFAGLEELQKKYSAEYKKATSLFNEYEKTIAEIALRKRELSLYEFEFNEIEKAQLDESEFEEVSALVTRGNKSAQVLRQCNDLNGIFIDGDDSCYSKLRLAKKMFERLEKMGAPLSTADLEAGIAVIEALGENVSLVARDYEIDEEALANALERIEIYNRILQKFGPALSDVFAHREKCESFLQKEGKIEENLNWIKEEIAASAENCVKIAEALSKKRLNSVKELSKQVEKQLSELGMPKTKFVCALVENKTSEHPVLAELQVDKNTADKFIQLGRWGRESAQFLLSANAGEQCMPIEKVASGGELSRTMLAIKNVLFEENTLSVFVFDEIDTGISGSVASKVGRKLFDFCQTRQAICITHLPQVACYSTNHFIVSKKIVGERTVSEFRRASAEEKVKEIAIMLSGEKITQESLAQAKSLIKETRI